MSEEENVVLCSLCFLKYEVGSVCRFFLLYCTRTCIRGKKSLIEGINNRLHESTLLSSLVAAISCARIARRRSQFYPPAAGIQR